MEHPSSTARTGIGTRALTPGEVRIAHEVRYMQKRASLRDARVVTILDLLLFSTETGDAWLLDRVDRLAARIARGGVAEQVKVKENKRMFAIAWKGGYRLDGPDFVYTDWESGRVTVISGYPTQQIARAATNAEAAAMEGT